MDPDDQLLPRDKLLRDTFTPAETFLFILILITANVAFWWADPRSNWLLGFFLIAAAMTPVVLKIHEHTHPFFITFLWTRFWLCTIPVWLLLLQFSLGLMQRPLESITLQGATFVQFQMPENNWLPVSTSAATTWPTALGFGAIYVMTVSLFLVPKSRAFFTKLMPCLCLSVALVALFGYVQAGLGLAEPLLTKGTGADDFFAFFPYDGHWAALAVLWTCASISMALLTTRYDNSPAFFESSGPWYLTGGTLLGASAFLVEARWPSTILILTYASMMVLVSIKFSTDSKDPHRKIIAWSSGLIAAGMFVAGIFPVFQGAERSEVGEQLRQTAWEIFRDRPLFGWGPDSFSHLIPFYGSDLLLGESYERAGSDALQWIAEIGLIGIIPWCGLIIFLTGRYLRSRHDIQFTNHLTIGLAAIILLAFLDSPFMSPAVFFSFFVLFFTALRWADLTRSRADEVDAARPNLVTPQSLRRVPFHVESENQQII